MLQLTAAERAQAKAALLKPEAERTRDEVRILAKAQKAQQEADLAALLAAVPKGKYCELAGRQQRVVDAQARRYKLDALLAPEVNLFKAIGQLHDLVAHNAGRLAALGEVAEAAIKDEERQARLLDWQQRNAIKALELKRLAEETIDAAEHAALLAWFTAQLQDLGHRLQTRFGPPAGKLLRDFLDRMQSELMQPLAAAEPKRKRARK